MEDPKEKTIKREYKPEFVCPEPSVEHIQASWRSKEKVESIENACNVYEMY